MNSTKINARRLTQLIRVECVISALYQQIKSESGASSQMMNIDASLAGFATALDDAFGGRRGRR